MFGKKTQPSPPPGIKRGGRGKGGSYWTSDPGPHTCRFKGGYQLNETTVRKLCEVCDAAKDVQDTPPSKRP